MDKQQKKSLAFGIVFSVLAIIFAVIYYFNILKFMDSYLALTYVVYFVGLALMFAGSYVQHKVSAKTILWILSVVLIVAAIVMLVIGLVKGYIDISFKN